MDYITKEIIRRAFDLGRSVGKGKEAFISWEPPISAADDPYGKFTVVVATKATSGTNS